MVDAETAWMSVKNSSSPGRLYDFADRFRQSPYAAEAIERGRELSDRWTRRAAMLIIGSSTAVSVLAGGGLAAFVNRHKIRAWMLDSSLRTLGGHEHPVTALKITPDGRRIVSADWGALKIWDFETGGLLHAMKGTTSRVYALALTPDGRRAISGHGHNLIYVWNIDDGTLLYELEQDVLATKAIAILPDGRRVASAAQDNTIKIWDINSVQLLSSLEGHEASVTALVVTPDGNRMISGSTDQTIKIWEADSSHALRTLKIHNEPITGVAVAPDQRRAISFDAEWRQATGKIWDDRERPRPTHPKGT